MLSEVCLSGEVVCCQKSVCPVRLSGVRRVFVREVACCQKSVVR